VEGGGLEVEAYEGEGGRGFGVGGEEEEYREEEKQE